MNPVQRSRDGAYVRVWQYEVPADKREAFERVYSPDGEWARLFRKAAGYRSTRLFADREEPGRYLTIDEWDSAEAYDRFHSEHSVSYEALDRRCAKLTAGERRVGSFLSVTAPE